MTPSVPFSFFFFGNGYLNVLVFFGIFVELALSLYRWGTPITSFLNKWVTDRRGIIVQTADQNITLANFNLLSGRWNTFNLFSIQYNEKPVSVSRKHNASSLHFYPLSEWSVTKIWQWRLYKQASRNFPRNSSVFSTHTTVYTLSHGDDMAPRYDTLGYSCQGIRWSAMRVVRGGFDPVDSEMTTDPGLDT